MRVEKKLRSLTEKLYKIRGKLLLPLLVGAAIALSAFIFMLLWNVFLVPVFGVTALTYWLAVKGWLGIYFVVGMIWLARELTRFIIVNITFSAIKKRIGNELAAHSNLMEHFNFGEDEEI